MQESLKKKEYLALKGEEALEKVQIAKNVATYKKRALVDRQQETEEQRQMYQHQVQNLSQMKFDHDRQRREMLVEQHGTVKNLKENYLNNQEALEYKRQQDLAKKAKRDDLEAQQWAVAEAD